MADADETLFLWINGLAGRAAPVDEVVQLLVSDYLVPVGLMLVLVGLWFTGDGRLARQRQQIGVYVALASMALSSLVVMIVNSMHSRPRPFDGIDDQQVTLLFYQPTDPSFPSNPAAATFGLAAGIWGVNRPVGAVMLGVAGLFALSRVYSVVHYPSDVLAGALIGCVVAFLVFQVKKLLGPLPEWTLKVARVLCLA